MITKKIKAKPNGNQKIRVIAGSLKNSNIFFTEVDGLRPTLNRHRERLFNWLSPYISGAKVLDLFAGSGILSIEAFSRGASELILVEKNKIAHGQIKANFERLKIDFNQSSTQIQIIDTDAIIWLQSQFNNPNQLNQFDVIFLDPPFNQNIEPGFKSSLLNQAFNLINETHCLKDGGLIYLEIPQSKKNQKLNSTLNQIFLEFPNYTLYKKKEFPNLCLILLQKKSTST